ncbi:SusC/RagA family TonB-linked outer membrane protein [Salegentibacter agarivorans]|nr:TonB-dependent receptor [Salegentibacter agarivorans]
MSFQVNYAQKEISGTVVDESNMPLPGVTVLIKNTNNGTATDFDGNYSLSAAPEDVLIFSFLGYESQEVKVGEQSEINITLQNSAEAMDEIVVIGYGQQKRKEVTGAVAQVKSEALEKTSSSDVGQALQGQIAGVNVTASSGQPGSNANILIRGVNSVFGSNEPLYVVDGIPQDGNPQLSIAEIETIDVLKDAASASIYGTRGSTGVILITTKQGKEGQMNIRATSYMGVQKITSSIDLLNFEDYMYADFLRKFNLNQTLPDETFTTLENNRYNFFNDTDLVSILENDNALIQNHDVNMSGGKNGLVYNISVNYFDQEGVLINSGLERLNVRANSTFKKGKWKITSGIGLRTDEQKYTPWRILLDGFRYSPYLPVIDPNEETISDAVGSPTSNDANNLNFFARKLKQRDTRNGDQFSLRFEVEYALTKNIDIISRAAISRDNDTRVRVDPLFQSFDVDGNLIPTTDRSGVWNQSQRGTSRTLENMIKYNKKFGDHQLSLLALYSAEKYTFTSFFAEKFDLISNDVVNLNGATLDPNVGTGNGFGQDRTNTLIGMLGRIQYNFKNKYILSSSIRRDGTSRFSEDNRWVIAPSISAAWNISSEPFWKSVEETINSLKIRASYGSTGNQGILDYSTTPTISLGYDYVFGSAENDVLALGAIQTAFQNPDAKWERKVEKNIGLDANFFDNKFSFTADLYDGTRENMLFPVILPPSAGGGGGNSDVILNVGDMRNYGVELAANYKHSGKFSWSVGATYAANENEITKMSESNKFSFLAGSQVAPGLPNEDLVTALREGYEAGAFFLIETDGIIRNQEELEDYQQIVPSANIGDLRYVDQPTIDTDGDGILDTGDNTITDDDRVYKGSGAPEFEVGLNFNANYKNFDLSMQWYGAFGGEIINGSKAYAYKQGTHQDLIYQFSDSNPNSNIPTHRGRDHANFRGYTDFWLQDGSFARMRNFAIGYSFAKPLIGKLGISKLRVFVAADNPITITDYDGFDPEVGNDGLRTRGIDAGTYPVSSQYRAGIEINF